MTTTAPCKKNPKIQLFIYFITYVHYNNIPKSIRCFKRTIRILAINLTFLTRLTRLYSNTLFVFTRTLIGNPQIPTRYHQCLVFSFHGAHAQRSCLLYTFPKHSPLEIGEKVWDNSFAATRIFWKCVFLCFGNV
uniref:Uncharacterized protein n=1 Tax=Cacopsylla melanoneura TaxID=428564 RepID=A0A8D9A8Q0_9HEMI